MYEACFGFQERPFRENAELKSYFPAESIEQARASMTRAVERGGGIGIVIGPPGTGKTLLCRMLAEQFRPEFDVLTLTCGRLRSGRALLQNLLFAFRLPYRELSEGELRLSLVERLTGRSESRRGTLMILDEAHVLPLRLLDEIRLLTNLTRDGHPCVQLLLAGGLPLEEKFANPKLESLSQRIASRCYLRYLSREETIGYVRHQLSVAGAPPYTVIDDTGLRAVHQATDGIPRLINQLCDHALMIAATEGRDSLNAGSINDAWTDLQQLPAPWKPAPAVPQAKPSTSIVEFGELDPEQSSATPRSTLEKTGGELAATKTSEFHLVEFNLTAPGAGRNDSPWDGESNEALDSPIPIWQDESTRPVVVSPSPRSLPVVVDPFDANFAEEEVVFCHYSTIENQHRHYRPRVVSEEGRELAEVLRAWENGDDDSRMDRNGLRVVCDDDDRDVTPIPDDDDRATILPLPVPSDDGAGQSCLADAPGVREPYAEEPYAEEPYTEEPDTAEPCIAEPTAIEPSAFVWSQPQISIADVEVFWAFENGFDLPVQVVDPTAGSLSELAAGALSRTDADSDDRDIILVEDDDARHFRAPVANESEHPNHRRYRQLFARLRHG